MTHKVVYNTTQFSDCLLINSYKLIHAYRKIFRQSVNRIIPLVTFLYYISLAETNQATGLITFKDFFRVSKNINSAQNVIKSLMELGLIQRTSQGKYQLTPAGQSLYLRIRDYCATP